MVAVIGSTLTVRYQHAVRHVWFAQTRATQHMPCGMHTHLLPPFDASILLSPLRGFLDLDRILRIHGGSHRLQV